MEIRLKFISNSILLNLCREKYRSSFHKNQTITTSPILVGILKDKSIDEVSISSIVIHREDDEVFGTIDLLLEGSYSYQFKVSLWEEIFPAINSEKVKKEVLIEYG